MFLDTCAIPAWAGRSQGVQQHVAGQGHEVEIHFQENQMTRHTTTLAPRT